MALNLLQRFQRLIARDKNGKGTIPDAQSPTFDWSWDERRDLYKRWESVYANSVYLDQADGGYRELILQEDIGQDTDKRIDGYYNPFGCIVDTYQNVLRGRFGRDILISENVDVTAEGAIPRTVNQAILEPIAKIWKWSNLDNQKESLQMWCALNGAVGLRIEAPTIDGGGRDIPPAQRKVRVRPVHPREIVDFNEDADGNVTDVLLEYSVLGGGLGEDRNDEATIYRELLTKSRFTKTVDGKEPVFDIPNDLGVCPFVLLRHKDIGSQFGVPAHFGSERIIHLVNWLLTRCSISVDRHVFAKWFAAASGQRPETFDLGDTSVSYVQMGPGDTAPKLEAIVAKLDFLGVERMLQFFISHLRQRQPELVLSSLEAMSGQSGETIAKLLLPIEERIMVCRSHYEDALTRAIKIGLSWGIANSLWDVGSGIGAKEAADKAYQDGLEDFMFNQRSALPETVFDKINRAKAEVAQQTERAGLANKQAAFVSVSEQNRIMGRTQKQTDQIKNERATQDVVDQNTQL